MDNIFNIIRDLDWSKPEDVQKKAMEQLQEIDDRDIIYLAQQNELNYKYCWHNAALVLKAIGYPRIKPVLSYLMEWFQDVNWPGVRTIVEIFRAISPTDLLSSIEDASKRSIKENDDFWAFGLVSLIKDLELEHLINKDLYNQLLQLSEYE
ncbi:DUF5071 domain-containing protein [Desulfosporosinus sp. PR]|uniref:DUF5071 domain-containing protein n=1 Tax=Candidatus Desulfosporosinus nitrosoreducens TaxID=3401928 RepID=UPI0027E9DA76|nr:DUF5071 domain-containing protein [Desulfosporosinus sp. PR]MDQ7096681.1 DUF5071 domain-containing protein [Desulfosporosinus sp. PR]